MSHEAKCSVYSELDYMEIHISVFLNLSYPFPFSAPSRLSTICRLSFSHTADTGNCGYYYTVLLCMLTKETAAALPYAEEKGVVKRSSTPFRGQNMLQVKQKKIQ